MIGGQRRPGIHHGLLRECGPALNLSLEESQPQLRVGADGEDVVTPHGHLPVILPPELQDADHVAGELVHKA